MAADIIQPTQWYWEYFKAADTWQFHAPDYTPEVSVIVKRHETLPRWITVLRNTHSTMPIEVFRILERMARSIDLFGDSFDGITRINIPKSKVLEGAHAMKVINRELIKKGKKELQ